MSTPTNINQMVVLRAMHKDGPPMTIHGVINSTGLTSEQAEAALEALTDGRLVQPHAERGWWTFTPHGKVVAASVADQAKQPAFYLVLAAAGMWAEQVRAAGRPQEADSITEAIDKMRALREAAEATVVAS